MDSTTKYSLLLKEYLALKQTDSNETNDIFFPKYSLADLIFTQTIFTLTTNITLIDNSLNLNLMENLSDVFEYYYTDISNIFPVFYRQLIFLCGPDFLECLKTQEDDNANPLDKFMNRKCIIMSYCNSVMNKNIFISQYLEPFINEELNNHNWETYNQSNNSKGQTQDNYVGIKKEFVQKTLENILIDPYCSLEELLYKVVCLPYTLNTFKDSALIVIEGINKLTTHKIDLNYVDESQTKRKICLQFGKKCSKHMGNEIKDLNSNNFNLDINSSEMQKKILEAIYYSLNDLYEKRNITLIQIFHDNNNLIHRANCIAFKQKKFYKEMQNNFTIAVDGYPIEFIFKLPSIKDKHKIYFLEPSSHLLNSTKAFFAILTFVGNDSFLFKVCYKEKGQSEIIVHMSKEINLIQDEGENEIDND